MSSDSLSIQGRLHLELIGPNGKIKQSYSGKNMIVTTGKDLLVQRLFKNTIINSEALLNPISHMSIGIDDTDKIISKTSLGNEIRRVPLLSITKTTDGTSSIEVTAQFPRETEFSTVYSIVEAGLFNSAITGQGDMLSRATFNPFNKAPMDTLNIIWVITVN